MKTLYVSLACLTALIAGCRGGEAPAGLPADTALQTLRSLFSGSQPMVQAPSVFGSTAPLASTGTASSAVVNRATTMLRLASPQTATRAALASAPTVQTCSGGGSLTFVFHDADGNGAVSAGDALSMQSSDCVERGHRTSGKMLLSVQSIQSGDLSLDQLTQTIAIGSVTLNVRYSQNYDCALTRFGTAPCPSVAKERKVFHQTRAHSATKWKSI